MQATIVKAWKDAANAHLAIRVNETDGATEYIGSTALKSEDGKAKTAAVLKAELVASAKALRDKQRSGVTDAGLSGSVEV